MRSVVFTNGRIPRVEHAHIMNSHDGKDVIDLAQSALGLGERVTYAQWTPKYQGIGRRSTEVEFKAALKES